MAKKKTTAAALKAERAALDAGLAVLTKDFKRQILRHVIILPMVLEDKSLSQEELGDAVLAGAALGFTRAVVGRDVNELVKAVGAVIEKT